MEEFLGKVLAVTMFLCLLLLTVSLCDVDRHKRSKKELEKELELKNEKIASLEKEIRLLKSDLYIEKYGFPEK